MVSHNKICKEIKDDYFLRLHKMKNYKNSSESILLNQTGLSWQKYEITDQNKVDGIIYIFWIRMVGCKQKYIR